MVLLSILDIGVFVPYNYSDSVVGGKTGWYPWSQYSLVFRHIGAASDNGFQVFFAALLQQRQMP